MHCLVSRKHITCVGNNCSNDLPFCKGIINILIFLQKDLLKHWDKVPVIELKRRDVIKVIDTIMDRGSPISFSASMAKSRRPRRSEVAMAITASTTSGSFVKVNAFIAISRTLDS